MAAGTPTAEVEIDEARVRALLAEQHPDLAELPIARLDAGWDNAMYRLGDDYLVRLPRRRVAVPLMQHEQAWLPVLAERLPIAIPTPLRTGRPGAGYPWPWSVLPWIPGRTADLEPPAPSQAPRLADFLRALHHPASGDAPENQVRGVPLRNRAEAVQERIDRLERRTRRVSPELLEVWRAGLEAPDAQTRRWLHGDLHPRNVLVEAGALAGIIDWGDVTAGDVATDLASVWMLFDDARARAACLERYGPSDPRLARAKGWAFFFAVVLLDTGLVDHPAHAAIGEATLRRLAEDT